jgi:hypothetical protein
VQLEVVEVGEERTPGLPRQPVEQPAVNALRLRRLVVVDVEALRQPEARSELVLLAEERRGVTQGAQRLGGGDRRR